MNDYCLLLAGRTMRESSLGNNNGANDVKGQESNMLKTSKAGEKGDNNGDFITMDYTPAKKNPPIHN